MMTMMKSNELYGIWLDWALAKALGCRPMVYSNRGIHIDGASHQKLYRDHGMSIHKTTEFFSHTQSALCLMLISRFCININHDTPQKALVTAKIHLANGMIDAVAVGETVEVAVARALVLKVLGESISVPSDLKPTLVC